VEKENLSRRSFLNKLWLVLGGLAFAEIVAVVFAFFKPRKPAPSIANENQIIIAGPVDSFEPGTVSAFIRGKFYLARLEDGGFLAMSRSCTHLSCTVPWVSSESKFICPCHSSAFDIRGEVTNPPAPRALDLYPVEIRNNVLSVDTSKLSKRSHFAAEQVTYPDNI
jgi:cytochrome b6-f complex iron-sulfur subunit